MSCGSHPTRGISLALSLTDVRSVSCVAIITQDQKVSHSHGDLCRTTGGRRGGEDRGYGEESQASLTTARPCQACAVEYRFIM